MTADNRPNGFPFNVLGDGVSDCDLFEDKTHDHLAECLRQLIESSDRGITIGLEGSWGSGKSTVLTLLREKIEESSKGDVLFFMFDAWAHEGDPLRRIFLESLIEAVGQGGEHKALREIAESISGRKKTVDVHSTKRASRFGKFLSFSAFFVPAGAALLNKVKFEEVMSPLSSLATWTPHWTLFFAILLVGAPFWLLIYWCFFGDVKRSGERDWDFFTVDSEETFTQDVSEDGERTSIEFENFFGQIIDYASSSIGFSKLIFIVDNLDRVDPQQAKGIWSTLQTFFQHRTNRVSAEASIQDRLWFIVPFDRGGFSLIWDGKNGGSAELSQSFLEKCFQVRAEVPPPVMSSWVKYLDQCVSEALAGWPADQREQIFTTFQRYHSNLAVSPTPRQIRSLVNQIGLNGALWGGKMSAEAICLYSILRSKQSEKEVRDQLIANNLSYYLDDIVDRQTLTSELSGMLFGVPRERGIQLLLGPLIISCMNNGDGGGLEKLIEEHGSAFWIAWRALVQAPGQMFTPVDSHTDDYRINFTNAICVGAKGYRLQVRAEIRSLQLLWQKSIEKWNLSQYDYASVLRNLLGVSDDPAPMIKWIGESAEALVAGRIAALGSGQVDSKSLIQVRGILDLAAELDVAVRPKRFSTLDSGSWGVWSDLLRDSGLDFPEILPRESAVTELIDKVVASVSPIDIVSADYLQRTIFLDADNKNWPSVLQKLSTLMSNPRQMNLNILYVLAFDLLSKFPNASTTLVEVLKTTGFWAAASAEDYQQVPYLCLVAARVFGADLQAASFVKPEVRNFWSSEQSGEKVDEIYAVFSSSNNHWVIWDLATDSSNLLAIQIVRKFVNEDFYSVARGATNINRFPWATKDDVESLAVNLCKYGAVSAAKEVFGRDVVRYDENLSVFYLYGDEKIRSMISGFVGQLSTDQWKDYLVSKYRLVDLIDVGGHRFTDAFKQITIEAFAEPMNGDLFWSNFDRMLGKVLDKDLTLKQIAIQYFEVEGDILSPAGFEVLTPAIATVMDQVSSEKIIDKAMNWLDLENWAALAWLSSLELPQTFAHRESLESRINLKLGDGVPGEVISVLRGVAEKLGVKILHVASEGD